MIFLKDEIAKLYNSQPDLFPQEINEINDALLENILGKILENSSNWRAEEKRNWRDNLQNKSNNYENIKTSSEKEIKIWIEKKINLVNKSKDKEQIKILMRNLLEKNENERLRTKRIISELNDLQNNQYKDYDRVPTRQVVYTIISELRKEYRENDFKNGYLISGKILDDSSDKVDGWQFTTNKDLILKYFKKEIEEHKRAFENFIEYKQKLEYEINKVKTEYLSPNIIKENELDKQDNF